MQLTYSRMAPMNSRWTRNQQRAVALAEQLVSGEARGSHLHDADWHLLLVAAGLSGVRVRAPVVVAERVLEHASRGVRYFARPERPFRNVYSPEARGQLPPAPPW